MKKLLILLGSLLLYGSVYAKDTTCIAEIQGEGKQTKLYNNKVNILAIVVREADSKNNSIVFENDPLCFKKYPEGNHSLFVNSKFFPEQYKPKSTVEITGVVKEFRPDFRVPRVMYNLELIKENDFLTLEFTKNSNTESETTIKSSFENIKLQPSNDDVFLSSKPVDLVDLVNHIHASDASDRQKYKVLEEQLELLEGNKVILKDVIAIKDGGENRNYFYAISAQQSSVQDFLTDGKLTHFIPATEQIGFIAKFKIEKRGSDHLLFGQSVGDIEGYLTEAFFGKQISHTMMSPQKGSHTNRVVKYESDSAHLTIGTMNLKNFYTLNFEDTDSRDKAINQILQSSKLSGLSSEKATRYFQSYFGSNSLKKKLDGLVQHIVVNMKSPDVIAIQELQDDDGVLPTNNVSAEKNLEKLITKLKESGRSYNAYQVSPEFPHSTSGQRGGNIRNMFLVKNDVGITDVEYKTILVAPENCNVIEHAFCNGRAPLLLSLTYQGKRYNLINVHLKSNYGDDIKSSRKVRLAQQEAIIRSLENQQVSSNTIILGDFNDDRNWSEKAFEPLERGNKFVELKLPNDEQYTHFFNGSFSQLDHIFISQDLEGLAIKEKITIDVAHFATLGRGATDHDGLVMEIQSQ